MGDEAALRVGEAAFGGRELAAGMDDLAFGAQQARLVVRAARVMDMQVERRAAEARLEGRLNRAGHAGVQDRRGKAAMDHARGVIMGRRRRRREDDAAALGFRDIEAQKHRHSGRGNAVVLDPIDKFEAVDFLALGR